MAMQWCLFSNALKRNRMFLFSLHSCMMKDAFIKSFRVAPFMILQKKFATQNDVIDQNKAINKRIIALGDERKWRDIVTLYHKDKREMNMANIATIYNQIAKMNCVIQQILFGFWMKP